MRYLHDDSVIPPTELLTKRQTKKLLRDRTGKQTILKKFEFKKEEITTNKGASKPVIVKKSKKDEIITINKYSSTLKSDWIEEHQAGFHFTHNYIFFGVEVTKD
jgi:hypothetical protein